MSDVKASPAAPAPKLERKRIPMSTPQRRLEVTPIVGYHLHWFRDDNIERAINAGYEFVEDREVELNQRGAATSRDISGNADLGTRVRIVSGMGAQGAEFLTLMKIKEEFFQEDQKAIENRNASIMSAIFRDEQILGSDKQDGTDKALSYVKQADANLPLFNRRAKKAT